MPLASLFTSSEAVEDLAPDSAVTVQPGAVEPIDSTVNSFQATPTPFPPKLDDVEEDAGLSKRLALALELRGMSQGALERAAGLPNSYASRLLKGLRPNIGFQTLRAIADALDVNLLWLATGQGAMNKGESPRTTHEVMREMVERYPNKVEAIAMASRLGVSSEAIAEVAGEVYASEGDLSVQAWLDRIREVDTQRKRDAAEPARVTKREELSQAKVDEKRGRGPAWGKKKL